MDPWNAFLWLVVGFVAAVLALFVAAITIAVKERTSSIAAKAADYLKTLED